MLLVGKVELVWAQQLQRQWTDQDSVRLLTLIGAFIVMVVAMGMIVMAVRKRMMRDESELSGARGLLDGLREMRKNGRMTEAEYESARRALASRMGAKRDKGVEGPPEPSYSRRGSRAAKPTPAPGFDLTGDPLPPESEKPRSAEKDGHR